MVFTIAAAAPEQRPVFITKLGDLREHNVKHNLAGMADAAQIVKA